MKLGKKGVFGFIKDHLLYVVFIALIILIGVLNPDFFSWRIMRDILMQSSVKGILALGMMFILLSGHVDLSAGRIIGASAVIAASLAQQGDYVRKFFDLPELPFVVPMLVGIAVAMLIETLNGFFITKLNLAPFIATLGTQLATYGFISLYYNLEPNRSQPIGGLTDSYVFCGQGTILGGVPVVFIIFAICAIIAHIMMTYHKTGKLIFAIGGNPDAAKVSGVNVKKMVRTVYLIAGFFIGLAGVLEVARTGGATNNYGNGYEFDAIAACTVGGVSMNGGVGAVPGVIIGTILFTVIQYGMTFLGINPYWQYIVKGLTIAIAVYIDTRKYAKN